MGQGGSRCCSGNSLEERKESVTQGCNCKNRDRTAMIAGRKSNLALMVSRSLLEES